ncbi:unnamed protein product [Albugo candida]|uniref:Uncharacterized protein n=1 Tax=Albugo candida TaxID=65357 RepID=A0A024FZU2_9STRA|nr:unnamed protein product [Albugo candida]|eukprot:CCI39892.1 unnamed protein product [Albugo candida]
MLPQCQKVCDKQMQNSQTNEMDPAHPPENRTALFSLNEKVTDDITYSLNCQYQYALRVCGGKKHAEKLWQMVAHSIEQRRYSRTEMIRFLLQSFAYGTPNCTLAGIAFPTQERS